MGRSGILKPFRKWAYFRPISKPRAEKKNPIGPTKIRIDREFQDLSENGPHTSEKHLGVSISFFTHDVRCDFLIRGVFLPSILDILILF